VKDQHTHIQESLDYAQGLDNYLEKEGDVK